MELDFARRFRESADVMRAIASGETNIRASGILERIAAEYDRTAEELEALDREHAVNPPSEYTTVDPQAGPAARAVRAA